MASTSSRLKLTALGVWVLIVLGAGSQTWAIDTLKGENTQLPWALLWSFNDWIGWLVLAPVVFYLARRFPVERPGLGRRLGLHLAAAAVVSAVHGLTYFVMEWATGQLWDEMTPGHLLPVYVLKNLVTGISIYAMLVALAQGIEYYRRYKEREIQLSRAELEVLKMQLQPHFLFNTLHAISALIRPDPDAADRIITRLGDLLRMSLQANGAQEVPLRQELEFVEKYADIQRTRFRDRLTITVEAEPAILDALVPSLILQPLVENSIRHGVERLEEAATIEIRAVRRGDRLVLTVSDDGPGFPDFVLTPAPGRGLGLGNTRARIGALYGDAGTLNVGPAAGGGAQVTIEIPWRTATGA